MNTIFKYTNTLRYIVKAIRRIQTKLKASKIDFIIKSRKFFAGYIKMRIECTFFWITRPVTYQVRM